MLKQTLDAVARRGVRGIFLEQPALAVLAWVRPDLVADSPANLVLTDAQVDATMALAGAAHTFTLFDRSALVAFIVPMGRISGTATVSGKAFNESANGFGDPMLEFDLNVIGPRV